jgi:hypothetical protein
VFLSLASTKRESELRDFSLKDQKVPAGRGYVPSDLGFVSQMSVGTGLIAVLIFALYINSEETFSLYTRPDMLWFALLSLLYWLLHIGFATNRGVMVDDPIVFAVKDPVSLFCGIVFCGALVCASLI